MSRLRADHVSPSTRLRRLGLAGAASLFAVALSAALPSGAAAQSSPKPAAAAAKPVKAASTKPQVCYSRNEHAAEQTIRMHTEMMVVGLTCREVVPEYKPFGLYQDFTVKHRSAISGSEAALIAHFNKRGGGGMRQFDTYRTELANEISRRASTIGVANYCAQFVERSKAANELTAAELKTLTSDPANAGIMHLASKPLCDVQVVSTPDAPFAVAQAAPPAPTKASAKPKPKAPAKPKPKVALAPASQTVADNAAKR